MNEQKSYKIPLQYRKMENLHIVFWLIKDLSWCMTWKALGIAMIIPTLIIAIVISWRTRHIVSEICHNAAIVFWITANSYWMVSEFIKVDALVLFKINSFDFTYKHIAIIPFTIGILILAYYYLYAYKKHKIGEEVDEIA
jgi:hypothetical protein